MQTPGRSGLEILHSSLWRLRFQQTLQFCAAQRVPLAGLKLLVVRRIEDYARRANGSTSLERSFLSVESRSLSPGERLCIWVRFPSPAPEKANANRRWPVRHSLRSLRLLREHAVRSSDYHLADRVMKDWVLARLQKWQGRCSSHW